ncbi:MAG: sodium:proton antiporter [Pseudobdellovibrionaceae bacterium]|jgi:multicomponent Na+:H+ antiporter subunit C
MNLIFSFVIAWLFGFGVYLLLKPSFLNLILGLGLISHSVNMALFFLGGLSPGSPSVVASGETTLAATTLDPVPQALVLTAIVIGLGMQVFLLVAVSQKKKMDGTASPESMVEDA